MVTIKTKTEETNCIKTIVLNCSKPLKMANQNVVSNTKGKDKPTIRIGVVHWLE